MADAKSTDEGTPKRRRDPEKTREAILRVAGQLLAKDGPEGLSVSQVAQLAGVNRGTAYHHFQTRDQLVNATTQWVSDRLCKEVFGTSDPAAVPEEKLDPQTVIEKLAGFAMEYPEFGRVWLFEVLSSSQPAHDPFWNIYKSHMDRFVQSEYAEPDVDDEVHAVLMLVGVFLWPVWARAHAKNEAERNDMAKRYSREIMRLSLNGTMRKDKFSQLLKNPAEAEEDKQRR